MQNQFARHTVRKMIADGRVIIGKQVSLSKNQLSFPFYTSSNNLFSQYYADYEVGQFGCEKKSLGQVNKVPGKKTTHFVMNDKEI